MDIGTIDASATLGRSWLHSVAPPAKLLAMAFVLGAVVVTWNLLVIATVLLLLVAVVVSARLRPRLAFGLAAYPAVFALIFAFSATSDPLFGAVVVLKGVTAALAAVVVVLSTPYPHLFAPLQRILPRLAGDALLMTYRATFLLLEKFSNLLRAVRLRSGLRTGHPVRAARGTAQALGGLLLYSLDLGRRDYDIMRLRGYEGRLRVTLPKSPAPLHDAALVAAAAFVFATSVLWRVSAASLNPFSWLPPLLTVPAFAAALLARWRPS